MVVRGNDLRAAQLHHQRGNAAGAQGRGEEAIAAYRAAIGACWSFAGAHNSLGIALASAQQLREALESFANASRVDPHWPDPHHNRGVVLQSLGEHHAAVDACDRAIALKAAYPEAHFNRGNALRDLARLGPAVESYRAAIGYRADYADAMMNLAQALQSARRDDEAIAAWRQLLKLRPTFAPGYHQLGRLLHQAGALPEAVVALRRALITAPNDADLHHDLANVLVEQGQVEAGIRAYGKALALRPDFPDAHYNLGNAFSLVHREEEAATAFRRAIEQRPGDARALNNLGNLLQARGAMDEAIACFTAATQAGDAEAAWFNNLGNALKEVARIGEAADCYQTAMALDPRQSMWASHRLYVLHFDADCSPEQLLEEHLRWDATYAAGLPAVRLPPRREDATSGKLRIGYVSGDFREHVVGRNILPLFREHDRERFEVYCYANQLVNDATTDRFKACADQWRDIRHLDDQQAAERIAQDQIDILVDLSLHMAGNRLLVFARRPAPVQITFAGYPSGTGLSAMDARLTDPYLDPPGKNDALYRERSIRLPDSFWCFVPTGSEPDVGPLPADGNGFITFGCFNNFCKVNHSTLLRWGGVLRAVEDSRLIVQAPAGSAREWVAATLAENGVRAERVSFVGRQSRGDYLALYNTIDIALDTLPYNGHTTSLEGLWMGVPLVTRAGEHAVARAGLSLLTNLGLADLCAEGDEQMTHIASSLAADVPRLRGLRQGLRERMVRSPLGDARAFARGIEGAYREAWASAQTK